ncbi:MAG TPA: M23 family metallopeptidase [Desulfuromonadaceae bacterium]
MRAFVSFLVLIIVVVAIVFGYFWGTSGPTTSFTPASGPISATRPLVVKVNAPRGDLKNFKIEVLQGQKTVPVLVKTYPSGLRSAQETFNLAQSGLKDGPFILQVTATGSTFFGSGRSAAQSHSFTFDNTPPIVAVLSTAHNIIRGGVGLVVYTVSKQVEKTGVVFADRFFPGFPQAGGYYACLFPFPYDMEPERYVPRVIAVDKAGNERQAGINFHLLVKHFSTDKINLSDSFLEKVAAEFKNKFPQAATPLEIFLKANGDLRRENIKSLYEYGHQTSPAPLWQGVFLRMPNTAPLGGFAQTRFYIYQGKQVDQQTHLGFDLASIAHAAVPAANKGRVVFAGDLGIYGQCVVIDHGMGLQTLYGHLSRMTVKAGDNVEKGQTIGNSGASGMAAGDHLHYGVTISGQEVNPVEWWDQSWIKNNITGKLEMAKGSGTK